MRWQILLFVSFAFLITLDSVHGLWWNNSFETRHAINNLSTLNCGIPYSVNGTVIRVSDCGRTGTQSLYNDTTNPITYAVANETLESRWENSSSHTGNNPTGVYASSVLGAWMFDDFLSADDSASNNLDGVVVGAVSVAGRVGSALDFELTDNQDVVQIADSPVFTGLTNLSVSFFIRLETTSTWQAIITKWDNGPDSSFFIAVDNNNVLDFRLSSSCTATGGQYKSNYTLDTAWRHIAVVWNGSVMGSYLDGVWDSKAYSYNGTMCNSAVNVTIGDYNSPTNPLDGLLDEVLIFNQTLTASEVEQLNRSGSGTLNWLGAEESQDNLAPLLDCTTSFTNNSWSTNASIRVSCDANDPSQASNISSIIAEWGNLTKANYTATHSATSNESVSFLFPNNADSSTSYTLRIYANDTAGNMNTTGEYLVKVDSAKPTVTITSPTNTTYATSSVSFNYDNVDNNLERVSYRLDNDENITIPAIQKRRNSSSTWSEGGGACFSTANMYDEDWNTFGYSTNTCNVEQNYTFGAVFSNDYINTTLTIETKYDLVATGENSWADIDFNLYNFTSGSWKEVYSANSNSSGIVSINISVAFSTDYISANRVMMRTELTTCLFPCTGQQSRLYENYMWVNATEITLSLSDGQHNVTVYANDSAGNLNSTTVYFTVDTTPDISVQSPLNQTYNSGGIWFNASASVAAGISWVGYSLDGQPNVSMANSSGNWNNLNSSVPDGAHNVRFYTNSTNGAINQSSLIYFTVDTNPPYQVNLHIANNTNYSTQTVNFNWTASDSINTSFYSNLTIDGVVNVSNISTSNNTYTNYSVSGLVEGSYNWSVTAYDATGNTSETRFFKVDLTKPNTSASNLTPSSVQERGSITFSINASDALTNVESVVVQVKGPDGIERNYSLTNTNGDRWAATISGTATDIAGGYNVSSFYTADYAGNTNQTYPSLNFTVTTTVGSGGGSPSGGGGGGGGGTTAEQCNNQVDDDADGLIDGEDSDCITSVPFSTPRVIDQYYLYHGQEFTYIVRANKPILRTTSSSPEIRIEPIPDSPSEVRIRYKPSSGFLTKTIEGEIVFYSQGTTTTGNEVSYTKVIIRAINTYLSFTTPEIIDNKTEPIISYPEEWMIEERTGTCYYYRGPCLKQLKSSKNILKIASSNYTVAFEGNTINITWQPDPYAARTIRQATVTAYSNEGMNLITKEIAIELVEVNMNPKLEVADIPQLDALPPQLYNEGYASAWALIVTLGGIAFKVWKLRKV